MQKHTMHKHTKCDRLDIRVDRREKMEFKKKAEAEGRTVAGLIKYLMRTYQGPPNSGRSGQSTVA